MTRCSELPTCQQAQVDAFHTAGLLDRKIVGQLGRSHKCINGYTPEGHEQWLVVQKTYPEGETHGSAGLLPQPVCERPATSRPPSVEMDGLNRSEHIARHLMSRAPCLSTLHKASRPSWLVLTWTRIAKRCDMPAASLACKKSTFLTFRGIFRRKEMEPWPSRRPYLDAHCWGESIDEGAGLFRPAVL